MKLTDPTTIRHKTDVAIGFLKQRPGFSVITTIHVARDSGQRGKVETKSWPLFHTDPKEQADCWRHIEERQGKANIYYGVNPLLGPVVSKAPLSKIARVVSFHVDIDPDEGRPIMEERARILAALRGYRLKPTWIIDSGNGYQGIWDLKPEDYIEIGGNVAKADDAGLYNYQIRRDLGGDACHSIDHIMRLPGTINCPDWKKREKGRDYTLASIVEDDHVAA